MSTEKSYRTAPKHCFEGGQPKPKILPMQEPRSFWAVLFGRGR